MNQLSLTSPNSDKAVPEANGLERFARRQVLARLGGIKKGVLTLRDGECLREFSGDESGVNAEVRVLDPRFYGEVAFGGAVGAGEAYVQGFWDTPDLTAVVRLLLRNRPVLEQMDRGYARLAAPLKKCFHWLHRNSRHGSRRNIAAHYDMGNDFFALWLDPEMMYSGALFEQPGMTLEQASRAKLERICTKLQLQPGDRVLEIGTGWGGFALHAARHYGCHVTTTTISREQFELARQRVTEAGLGDRITLLLDDYRDLEGQFDKLVSIEMIEAIGHRNFDRFFERCCRLLTPQGLMCLQAITMADQHYDRALRSVDFIQRYIFPGGCLPSLTAMTSSLTRRTDMRVLHCEDIGPHYATTLSHWRQRFNSTTEAIRNLGYSQEFLRLWQYYLEYCEGAFLERAIGNVQLLLARPENRREAFLG